jgi:hypothetical protein
VAASITFSKEELSSDEAMNAARNLGLNLIDENDNRIVEAVGEREEANERLELFR